MLWTPRKVVLQLIKGPLLKATIFSLKRPLGLGISGHGIVELEIWEFGD